MNSQSTILRIEAAPGDAPRGVEQPNGDLLLPATVRPLIEQALLQIEEGFFADLDAELPAMKDVRRLLGIAKPDVKNAWTANLYRVRPI